MATKTTLTTELFDGNVFTYCDNTAALLFLFVTDNKT